MKKILLFSLLLGCNLAAVEEAEEQPNRSDSGDDIDAYDGGISKNSDSLKSSLSSDFAIGKLSAIEIDEDSGTTEEVIEDKDADIIEDASETEEEPETDSEICVCDDDSKCCDGCNPRNIGESCDDQLRCKSNSICLEDGSCGKGTDACTKFISEPECQRATCSESSGCVVQAVRSYENCSDDDDSTYDDICIGGECIGQPCECSSGDCCDGCHVLPVDTRCSENVIDGYSCGCPDYLYENIHFYRCDGLSANGCNKLSSSSTLIESCGKDRVCYEPAGGCVDGPNDMCI